MDYKNLAAQIMMPRLQLNKYNEFEDYKFYIKKINRCWSWVFLPFR